MHLQSARQIVAVALILTLLTFVLTPPHGAAASHLPPLTEIVVRPADLPSGFEPVDEPSASSLLPAGLARQAAASFQRDPAQASETGVHFVRQVVMAFDDRAAVEYLTRFQDLMARHQGYAVVESNESAFHLSRTRSDETSIVVGMAHGEVLIMTTVAGLAGTVGAEDAAHLSGIAVARVPVADDESIAYDPGESPVPFGGARPGPGALNLVNQQEAVSYPQPVETLPVPPDIDVVQARNARTVGDPSLDVLVPDHSTGARSTAPPTSLVQYMTALEPLLNEFWGRVLSMSTIDYVPPRLVVVPLGGTADTSCLVTDGDPVFVRGLTYCPANRTVFAYESYFANEVLAGRDWQQHDITIATLMARTWGHHIQLFTNMIEVTAILAENQPDKADLIARQRELEASCYAGLFMRHAQEKGWLGAGDLDEARASVGRPSDVDVEQTATPEQRQEWFMRGYMHYAFRYCDAW